MVNVSSFIEKAVYSIVAWGGDSTRKADTIAEKTALADLLSGAQTPEDKEFIEGFMLKKGASKAPKVDGKNPEVNAERSFEYDLSEVPIPEGFNNFKGKQKIYFDENGKIKQLVQRDENGTIISVSNYEHNGDLITVKTNFMDGSGKSVSIHDKESKKVLEQTYYDNKDNIRSKIVFAPNGDIHRTHYSGETVELVHQTKNQVTSSIVSKDNQNNVHHLTITKTDDNGVPIEAETEVFVDEKGERISRKINAKFDSAGVLCETIEVDPYTNKVISKAVKGADGQMEMVVWQQSSGLQLLPGRPGDPNVYEERIVYFDKEKNTVIEETRHYDEDRNLYSTQRNKEDLTIEEYERRQGFGVTTTESNISNSEILNPKFPNK